MSHAFRDAMAAAGVDPVSIPLTADGGVHRFRGPGDNRENCWYALFDHGGAFGSWRLGISEKWHNGAGKLSKEQRRELENQIRAAQTQAEAERKKLQDAAAQKARLLVGRAVTISDPNEHAYLVRKRIQPYGVRLLVDRDGEFGGDKLVIPLLDEGAIVNLQFIKPDGEKRFLSHGRVAGCYCLLENSDKKITKIAIGEGFATVASVCEATGIPGAVAFNAANLSAVARSLRKKYPSAEIVLLADDDRTVEGNPGIAKAREAAQAAGARLAIPKFPEGVAGTDFNDLACALGLDAVRKQIEAAIDDGVPANFKLREDMLCVLIDRKTKDGGVTTDEYPVCSRLEVVALTRDESGGEWGRLLCFDDPDGREQAWAMPMEMLAGDGSEYRARLLEQGLIIFPSREARSGLHEYLARCRPLARAHAVSRIGWHDGVFVFPDHAICDTGAERMLYQSSASVIHAFHVRGSLRDWRREVATRCAGNSRLVLAVSAAFAAALLSITGDESGGLHFVGRSSVGKTTALRVGGSVWGGSQTQSGYLRQWRATANGLEGIAALHCDTLLCLDELSEVNPREAGQVAFMLANGAGKSRAHRDGSARKPHVWRLLFLSSGEITLADKVREDGRQKATAGQTIRILDIPADCGSGLGLFENIHGAENAQVFADHLRAATQEFHGTAARAFLTEIAKQKSDRLAQNVREHRNDFIAEYCSPGADGQIQRAATRYGLVAAAGELATALGITEWDAGDATWAARVCFQAWLDRRGHIGPAELQDGIDQVRRFFALHGESRFTPENRSANPHPCLPRSFPR